MDYKSSKVLTYRKAKWQVAGKDFYHKLVFDYGLEEGFEHPSGYYSLKEDSSGNWWLIAHVGCAWDGVTGYFDKKWMMGPSLVHDILHWLTRRGIIEEKFNGLIDREFERAIIDGKEPISFFGGGNSKWNRKRRAKYAYNSVRFIDEKRSEKPDIRLRKILV